MDVHSCSSCGFTSHRWFGRCPECGGWSTAAGVPLATGARSGKTRTANGSVEVRSLAEAGPSPQRLEVGCSEVDAVLGGGFVPGAVVLLAGEPGVGKSTLVLQILHGVVAGGATALLVSGEESIAQIGLRARRLKVDGAALRATTSTSLQGVLAAAAQEQPDVLVIDSIQTLADEQMDQAAGSTAQVRECAAALARFAKVSGTVVLLVGHVTKEGNVAGPKTLEHLVDVVLGLEGERSGTVRLLRAIKNRFGSCEETGVFAMCSGGLEQIADPSAMLLADRSGEPIGSVIFPALEGTRPMMVELQALVAHSDLANPRRVPIGVDPRRLALILGVMTKQELLPSRGFDVFAAVSGGISVKEPAADLALCLAIHSSNSNSEIYPRCVVVGEVGLAGEVRRAPGIQRRMSEAARLGFDTAIVPKGTPHPRDLDVIEVSNVSDAVAALARRMALT